MMMLSDARVGERPVTFAGRHRHIVPRMHGFCGPTFDVRDEVRSVVLVACSSRGGSSMVCELLRRCDQLLHFRGEITPILALSGMTRGASGEDSDALGDGEHPGEEFLAHEMSAEIGNPVHAPADLEQYAREVAWRLTVAWSSLGFGLDDALAWVRGALASHSFLDGRGALDVTALHLEILLRARAHGVVMCPYFYDVDHRRIPPAYGRPGAGTPLPFDHIIEEPPFVPAAPWRRATPADVRDRPLVIKTPSNAFRLPFLKRFFRRARFRVLHLTRNPAAAINGLWDGWRFHGFHAHRMSEPLQIAGYSDYRPQDRYWWKFDLPPGWRDYMRRPLPEVCAWQWCSAHTQVLDWVADSRVDSLRVKFEDLIGAPSRRAQTIRKVFEWLGIAEARIGAAISSSIPPIMATVPPRTGRWKDRGDALSSVLAQRSVLGLVGRLAYEDRDAWI